MGLYHPSIGLGKGVCRKVVYNAYNFESLRVKM